MLVMVVFFIAFRWIHLSTPLIRLFLLVLILLLMPTLNFLPVWFALSLLRLDRKSGSGRNAETDLVCRLLLEKKKMIRPPSPLPVCRRRPSGLHSARSGPLRTPATLS